MEKYRNDYRKNVVYCGFNEVEKRSLVLYDSPGPLCYDYEITPYRKAPINIIVDTFDEALKHRGLALYLKVDRDIDLVRFDKKYRKKLDYWFVRLYNQEFKYKDNKYSNISFIDEREMFSDYIDQTVHYIETYFKKHKTLKLHPKKKEKLDLLHDYMKQKKELKTSDLAVAFNINIRNVQRYMNDINTIYNDVGYDYSNNIWYICE